MEVSEDERSWRVWPTQVQATLHTMMQNHSCGTVVVLGAVSLCSPTSRELGDDPALKDESKHNTQSKWKRLRHVMWLSYAQLSYNSSQGNREAHSDTNTSKIHHTSFPLCCRFSLLLPRHHHHHLSLNHEGRWGITDDFTTSFLHLSLCSTALWELANSRPVHSLMLSSHLFLCLPCLLPPFTVPCKMVSARPYERKT